MERAFGVGAFSVLAKVWVDFTLVDVLAFFAGEFLSIARVAVAFVFFVGIWSIDTLSIGTTDVREMVAYCKWRIVVPIRAETLVVETKFFVLRGFFIRAGFDCVQIRPSFTYAATAHSF